MMTEIDATGRLSLKGTLEIWDWEIRGLISVNWESRALHPMSEAIHFSGYQAITLFKAADDVWPEEFFRDALGILPDSARAVGICEKTAQG
jgi:hypothetical protein